MFEGIGDTISDLGDKAFDLFKLNQQNKSAYDLAQINAQSEATVALAQSRSNSLLYWGIGIFGAAYLLFTLRKMEA